MIRCIPQNKAHLKVVSGERMFDQSEIVQKHLQSLTKPNKAPALTFWQKVPFPLV